MKPRYFIGDLSLDSGGTLWITYVGDVPEQGGSFFGKGQIGFSSVEDALEFLKSNVLRHLPDYQTQIKKRESNDPS